MFKKNTAVTGFKFHLVSKTDGSDITTGTPVGYYTLDDGTQTAIGDVTPVHKGNGEWAVDLLAAEMNGVMVGLVFTHASAITVKFEIKTVEYTTDDIAAQVGNIATGSAAVSTVAIGQVLTTGTQVNNYTDTETKNDIEHEISDAAGALELYYEFDVSSDGIGSEVSMWGRLVGANDSIGVYAYNWAGATWDKIGDMTGSNGTTNGFISFNLLTRHTGAGANLGKVRVRGYAASGLSSATLYIDQAYVSYAYIPVSRQTKGTVVDVSPATTAFDTDLTAPNAHWDDALLIFTSGILTGQARPINTYLLASGALTFPSPDNFTAAPANGDSFIVYHTHIHPLDQMKDGIATAANQDLIKAKTDQMVFTKANELDVNTLSMNNATVVGDGNVTPWDGA